MVVVRVGSGLLEEGGNEACRGFGSGRIRLRGRRGVRSVVSLGGREVEVGDLVGVDGFDVVVREGEWGLVVRFD